MSPVAHFQYGWWFAHWGEFTRRERAVIALAGAAPDLDGVTFLAGAEPFHRYHHILFHNAGSVLAVLVVALAVFIPAAGRRPGRQTSAGAGRGLAVALLAAFAFAMHMVEDYVTVGWNQYPWRPFSSSPVNLADHLPGWLVQGVFQAAAMLFVMGTTVWIYRRHRRSPLEVISPSLDRLLVNYAVLPFTARCALCQARARYRCDLCFRTLCTGHGRVAANLTIRCLSCAAPMGERAQAG